MKTAIGLMSGTSMDGIDIALLRTDGENRIERGPSFGISYEPAFRTRLKQGLEDAKSIVQREERPGALRDLERDLTLRHAQAVHTFLTKHDLRPDAIDAIGFHGQTVLHRPQAGLTVQIGDGALLARKTGISVVHDMRANDMRHGGQGAPLIPVYHAALARNLPDAQVEWPVVFVNIGGISNLTCIDKGGQIIAFDSGPGNTLIDQWVETHAGIPYDQGGMIASEGRVLDDLAQSYLSNVFFSEKTRRSLDRNDFLPPTTRDANLEDGARTLAYVTAAAILTSVGHLPQTPKTYIVCGGGRLNRIIMQDLETLAALRGATVASAEDVGLNGDAMEAEAWAYLAIRSLEGLPLTFPQTTGVREPVTGGVMVPGGKLAIET